MSTETKPSSQHTISSSELVSLYLTRTGLVACEILRHRNSKGSYSYRYNGKLGAGCGSLKSVVESIRSGLLKPSIRLVKGADILQLEQSEKD